MVGAASFKLQRQSGRPSKPPARGSCATSSSCSGSGSVEDGATRASLQPPLPHTTTAKAEGGGGEGGRGARPRCPHRCPCSVLRVPCVKVPSLQRPSNCRGSKQVASNSDEGNATCASLPLLWGWRFSRQQDRDSAGVWCEAWGAHATDATTSFHACLTALRYVEGAFALTHARCTCNV